MEQKHFHVTIKMGTNQFGGSGIVSIDKSLILNETEEGLQRFKKVVASTLEEADRQYRASIVIEEETPEEKMAGFGT